MSYPPEFAKEVIAAFPNNEEIMDLLKSGSVYALRQRLKGKSSLVRKWRVLYKRHRANWQLQKLNEEISGVQ